MQVLVLGAGAMGCLYGAAWHRGGCDVALVDVTRPHVEEINRRGLELETRRGTELLPIRALLPADVTQPVDLVVVFTKTFHTAAALEGIRAAIGPATHLLSLQNGLGNDRALAQFVPPERVIVGASTMPSDLVGPGKVRSHGEGGTKLYPAFDGDPEVARQAAERLTAGGISSTLDPQIGGTIWSKAIFNAVMNPLCALTLRTPGFLGAHEESRALIREAVEEGVAAAWASGVAVDAAAIHALTQVSMTDHANHEASMLQDVKAGRRTEVDSINGEIVRAAKAGGVAAPLLETLWRLVKLEEAKLEEARLERASSASG
jgi:2-dehydropantoate 2-reductase